MLRLWRYPDRLRAALAATERPLDVESDGEDRHVLSNGVVIYGTREQAERCASALAAAERLHDWTTDDQHDYEWCRVCLVVRQRNDPAELLVPLPPPATEAGS